MHCDFCGVSIDRAAAAFLTSEEIQQAVRAGLSARDIADAITADGVGELWSADLWSDRAAQETIGWLLCPGCAALALRFLAKEGGVRGGQAR